MLKRKFFWSFATIILLVFTSCENGVHFDPTEFPIQPGNGGEADGPKVFTAEVTNKGTGYSFTGSDSNYEIVYIDLTESSAKVAKTVSIELSLGNLHATLPITVGYIPSVVERSNAPNFIGKPTFNNLDFEAVGITSDKPIIKVDIPLASNLSIDQTGIVILKFSDDSGNTYDTEKSPKEIKITIKRDKYEKIEFGDPLKFTAKVTNKGTDYTFDEAGGIVYTDLTEASAIEAKTVSIELALENLHNTFPITVEYTETDEKGFIGKPVIGSTTLVEGTPKLQIKIPLAANKDADQTGTVTLKFNDGSGGIIYDIENSPKEIQIPIKRNKYTPPTENSVEFTATVVKGQEGADYTFSGSGRNYTIEYTDTLEASTEVKTVSVQLTLAGLHPDASITVGNTKDSGFIGDLVFNGDNIASQATPALNIDIPLTPSSTDQEGTITLTLTPSNTEIYKPASLEKITITVKRNRYIAPTTVTLDFPIPTDPSWLEVINDQLTSSSPTVSITDTEGKGFGSSFNLITFPAIDTIPLGNQDIKVTIENYIATTGTGDFLDLHFCPVGDCYCDPKLKTSTFKPDGDNSKLRVDFLPTFATQEGTITINFEYDENVYKDAPTQLTLNIRSNGTKKVIAVGSLTEQSDDTAVEITGSTNNYDLAIKDPDKASTNKADYEIPLQINNLIGVLESYPVTITAKDNKNLTVSNIERNYETTTFTATHLGIEKLQATEGSVTLTIDSEHKGVYGNLPINIVINTKRDESFKYYIEDYANKFTVSTSTENLKDNTGYYTEVRIPGMSDAAGTTELSYVISRKDDRNGDFKELYNETIIASEEIELKDYNAFILRTEPQYTITVTHVGCSNTEPCTSEIVRTGSRKLTDREVFLAAMDSMRYALIDKGTHFIGPGMNIDKTTNAGGGSFKHTRWYIGWEVSYGHSYDIVNYKPYFITLGSSGNGNFQYIADGGVYDSINTVWDNWVYKKAPFTGTVSFASPYGNGSIIFNSVNIDSSSDNGLDGAWWHDGSFTVKVGDRTATYDKNSDIPFGLYLSSDAFLSALNADNYTQK